MRSAELLAKAEQAARLLDEVHVDIGGRANSDDEDEYADNLCDDAVRAAISLVAYLKHQAAHKAVGSV